MSACWFAGISLKNGSSSLLTRNIVAGALHAGFGGIQIFGPTSAPTLLANSVRGGAGWGLYLADDVIVTNVMLGPNALEGNQRGEVRDADSRSKALAALRSERPSVAFDEVVRPGEAIGGGERVLLLPGAHAFLAGRVLNGRALLTKPA